MSFVFSKNKEKRSRSLTGESNSSFVKNVTSRVSGLLPAGITKWFSSPSSSSANGSAAIADGTDSSTEDEAPESPSMIQPPAKRIRYSSPPGKYFQLTTSEITTTSNTVTETGSVLYTSIQSPPVRHAIRRDSNPDRDSLTQHTVSAIGQSIAQKRKSLFDSDKQREQSLIACAKTAAHQVKDTKQPHFKPYLLGSPFYHGQTTYGGASASTSYMELPNIKQRKMTYVNESSDADSVNMSSSSRRVLDLLENYSSPLIEAKRIPRYELSEILDINRSKQPSTSTRHSYKTQELYVPSTATLIRMKARGRLMDSTKAARQIIASHSSTLSFQPYAVDAPKTDRPDSDTGGAKSQSKLKSRLTRPNRGEDHFVLPETVELPTVVLQIDKNNLPKFTFEGPTSKPVKKSNKPIYETFKFSNPLPITAAWNTTAPQAPAFDFGSPEKASENTTPPKFSFKKQTSVEAIKTKPQPEKQDEPAKTDTIENAIITFAKASDNWSCPDCWASNKQDVEKCACCGAKQPRKPSAATATETTSKCTTCKLTNSQPNSDKCVNCEKLRANIKSSNSLPATKKANSSKWKCGECWVDNEKSAKKCVCCGSQNTQQSSPAAAAPLANSQPTAPLSKEKDWRCEDCLITNKPTIKKCAACGGAKPGTKPVAKTLPSVASTNIFKEANNKMIDIMQAQKSYWECSVCLASNANEKPACMCCDAERYPQDSVQPKFTNFKFNADSNTSFKFGIDPKDQETNLANKIDESSKPKNTEESETNNNIVPKIPSFTFTLPAKKPNDSPKVVEEVKPSFSFGIPKQNATPIASSFVPVSKPDVKLPVVKPAEVKEKAQEVPSITFKTPEVNIPSSNLFSSQAPIASSQNAMNVFLNNSESQMTPPSTFPMQPSATLEAPKLPFSFSASNQTVPSTGGLFTAPAPTAVSNSLATQVAPASTLATGVFSKPEAIAAPSVSFFTNSETAPAQSTTLFQSSVPSNPAPASTTPTPMFSFGNVQNKNPAPAIETKGFNFSFGSSSTAPAFGAAPQTNTNTFGLPAPNPLTNGPTNPVSGNVSAIPLALSITGNPLGGTGGNGLASGNEMIDSSSAPMFSAPAKENTSMWPSTTEQTNQSNPFMASTPKPTFLFGATSASSPFGAQASNTQPHVFGSAQPAQNMFGMSQSNANQPSMFANPTASQATPMFGAQPVAPAQPMGMFGGPTATPFGSSSSAMSTFEEPAQAPSTAFSFGGPQPSPGVFGFGQQPQQQQMNQQTSIQPMQQQPTGMYSFGAAPSPASGQVQFAMGSGPSATSGRRVRKAVRKHQR